MVFTRNRIAIKLENIRSEASIGVDVATVISEAEKCTICKLEVCSVTHELITSNYKNVQL